MLMNLCSATSPYLRVLETSVMTTTPLDYWKNGMDLWFKAAEVQIDMGFRMMAAMPGWDVALVSARGLSDDRVSLKDRADRPQLRSVTTHTPVAKAAPGSAPRVALKPVPAASADARGPVASSRAPQKTGPEVAKDVAKERSTEAKSATAAASAREASVVAPLPKSPKASKTAPSRAKSTRQDPKPATSTTPKAPAAKAKPRTPLSKAASPEAKPKTGKAAGKSAAAKPASVIAEPVNEPAQSNPGAARRAPSTRTAMAAERSARKPAAASAEREPARKSPAPPSRRRRAPATPKLPASMANKPDAE